MVYGRLFYKDEKLISVISMFLKQIKDTIVKNHILQGLLVAYTVIIPVTIYLVATNSIVAPLNILSGWDPSLASNSVVAKIPSDVNQQILPFRNYIRTSLLHGELPIWNSMSFAGDTFLANPINTAFSPLNFLLLFVDIYSFQNVLVTLGFFLLILSMYLLLKQLNFSMPASMIGALAYGLAPFSIFWSIYGIVAIPMSALPLSLFFYFKWREKPIYASYYLLGLVLTLGLCVYFGHIQITILPYIVVFLVATFDLIRNTINFKHMSILVTGIFAAIFLSLAQIGPMLVQTPLSHRTVEIHYEGPRKWGDRFAELMDITSSYNLNDGPTTLGRVSRREANIGQIPGILFIIGLILLLSLYVKTRKITDIYFFVFLFLLGLSWEWNDFPQTLLNALSPTFRSLASDYFLPLALLSMSVISAFGFDWLRNSLFKNNDNNKRVMLYFIPGCLLFLIVVLGIKQLRLSEITSLGPKFYLIYTLLIVSFFLWLTLTRNYRVSRTYLGVIIITLTLIQGLSLLRVSQPVVPRAIVDKGNPQLKNLTSTINHSPYIVDYIGPQESGLYNVSLINGYDSLYTSSLFDRIKAINYPTQTPVTYRNNSLLIVTKSKPILFQNLGIEYTINERPTSGYQQILDHTYKSEVPVSQVYFAKKVTSQSLAKQLQTIKAGSVSFHEVIIDGKYQSADPKSEATYIRKSNSITINTQSSSGGLVFIAQTYNKDWSASLENGIHIPIHPAYYNFSAIDVPSGKHTITLMYRPFFVIQFIILSIATLILIIFFIFYLAMKNTGGKQKNRRI